MPTLLVGSSFLEHHVKKNFELHWGSAENGTVNDQ